MIRPGARLRRYAGGPLIKHHRPLPVAPFLLAGGALGALIDWWVTR